MPIIQSAKKRMKQAEARRKYNVAVKSAVKKHTKAVNAEIATGDVKSNQALIAAIAQIDKAVKKGTLHKRNAARRKSRLTLRYNAVAKQPFGTEKAGAKKSPAKKAVKPAAKKTAKKTTSKK